MLWLWRGLGLRLQSLVLGALAETSSHVAFATSQAEGWVRSKLRDLKDGCDLQDWEEVAQTLQRDMKDFENTLIKLNQVRPGGGTAPIPLSTHVPGLSTVRGAWEPMMLSRSLGPTDGRAADVAGEPQHRGSAEAAAGPARPVAAPEADSCQPEQSPGGAAEPAGLQQESRAAGGVDQAQGVGRGERGVGRRTAWLLPTFSHPLLAQEEKPSLAALLQESPDKIQLTRRILDLKQVRGCWEAAGMLGSPEPCQPWDPDAGVWAQVPEMGVGETAR